MYSELKYVDSTEIKVKVISKFACEISEDNYISISTDQGVLVCKLHPSKGSILTNVTYNKLYIAPSTYVLSVNLEIDIDVILASLNQFDAYESILRPDMSAGIENCAKKKFKTVDLKWSPPGLMGPNSLITMLNDAGSLDVYRRVVEYAGLVKYVPMLNITQIAIEKYKYKWQSPTKMTATDLFLELKRRLDIQTPTSFEWTHLIQCDSFKYSILAVAFTNGNLAFWKIYSKEDKLNCDFITDCATNLRNIKSLHWRPSENSGLLFVGNDDGKLIVLPITIEDNNIIISDHIIFNEKEDVRVEKISSSIDGNNLYVYAIKQSSIEIYLLNNKGEFLDKCIFYAGNINITGFQIIGKTYLLVQTFTGVLKEIAISVSNNKINIKWKNIYVNINWSLKRCFGFFTSRNNMIATFITDACKAVDMKVEKYTFHFTNFINKYRDPLKVILENEDRSLYYYDDCFEALRLNTLQTKQISYEEFPKISYDDLNLIQLKTYYNLSKISEQIDENAESSKKPLKPSAEIETMIQIKLAVFYIRLIIKNYEARKTLSDFDKRCLQHSTSFLNEIIIKDFLVKHELESNFVEEVYEVLLASKNIEFSTTVICNICENDLFGTFCLSNHNYNKCLLSLTQISHPKFRCPICKRFLAEEAVEHFSILNCPVCDFTLDVLEEHSDKIEIHTKNVCKEDCLREDE